MMHYKIYFLSLLSVVYGLSWDLIPKECGRTRFDNNRVRIIDGDKADLGQFPWMVRLGKSIQYTKVIFFFCGATLVNRYYVISAAHCEDVGNTVRIGENYLNADKDCDRSGQCAPPHQDIKILKYHFSNYDKGTFHNDISLIELEQPVTFNEFVQPICLPKNPMVYNNLINMTVTVSGWGLLDSKENIPSLHLNYITAPILKLKECEALFRRLPLQKGQMCVGYYNEGRRVRDSCTGDSGGPASKSMNLYGERRTYMIGVVSYGTKDCGIGPAVYTVVSDYLEFILGNIKKD